MKWMGELIKKMSVTPAPGTVFCLLLKITVSIHYAQPITSQVFSRSVADMHYCITGWTWIWLGNGWHFSVSYQYLVTMVIGHCSHIMATSARKWQGFTPHHRKHKLICKLQPIIIPRRNTVQIFSLIYRIPNIIIIVELCGMLLYPHRDQFMYMPSQWETTLQCNVVSQWLGRYRK